jgi:hypothetical protein
VGIDVQAGLGAFGGEGGEGGDADGDVVADAAALQDGLAGGLGEQASAERSDHHADSTGFATLDDAPFIYSEILRKTADCNGDETSLSSRCHGARADC